MSIRTRVASIVLSLTVLLALHDTCDFSRPAGHAADKQTSGKKPASKTEQKSLAEELPRIKAVEVADALKTFHVEQGFRLEMVAAEPDIGDPVDACFDAAGRMYVAEMHGYPFSHEPTKLNPKGGGKYNAGIIRLLEDTDGDGRMDRSVKFADDMTWPTSVCCYNGGVFVLAPPHIHYFKDTTGDGVADVREIVYSGFGRGNVQSLANNMKWSLDNRIYLAAGRNGGSIKHRGKETVITLGGKDMSFDPATEKVEPQIGGIQFGHSMDNWGNRFVCSNSNHIQHVVFPYRYLGRNPYFAASGTIRSIAKGGAAAPVFRRSSAEPWRIVRTRRRVSDPKMRARLSRTERFAIGFFTSATGVTIYRGSAYPPEFHGNAFIGDVGANMVHRKTMTPRGASFVAERADEKTEFVASTDNWFRPTNFVNAPDGTLYVLDMYRETIEHPYSIPVDIKAYLKLESGDDRGRVYRLVAPNTKRIQPPNLAKMNTAQLAEQLASANSWNRETAQRLLVEQRDASAAAAVENLFLKTKSPLGRLHALYTLDGLSRLTAKLIDRGLKDAHDGVREHAVRLSEPLLNSSPELVATLVALANDKSYRVRLQLAFSLGEADSEKAVEGLAALIHNEQNDSDIRTALMTSVAGKADRLAVALIQDIDLVKQSSAADWLTELTRIVGADKNPLPAIRLLTSLTALDGQAPIQQLVLKAMGEGLSRRGSSVSKLLGGKAAGAKVNEQIRGLFKRSVDAATNDKATINQRVAAVGLLAHADYDLVAQPLAQLMSPQIPQALQLAAVQALANQSNAKVAERLISNWRGYSPQVRRQVVDGLLQSTGRIDALFAAVESKRIQRAEIERDKKQLLMNHPNGPVRTRARKVFGGEVSSNRVKVVAAYRKVLDLQGNSESGKAIFKKNCSICHRVGDVGHQVAPDLASTQNKSTADLLIAILDPNREAQPNFATYTVVTNQGKIISGIIAAETATSLTLRRAEAKQDVVLRSNIDTLSSNGKSLMPEGLEKEITPQQMADVIEFVHSIKPAKKASK